MPDVMMMVHVEGAIYYKDPVATLTAISAPVPALPYFTSATSPRCSGKLTIRRAD
jgi:hypothetical protein